MGDVVKYTALVRLKMPNPGGKPSSVRFEPGDIFSLEGNEGIDIGQLLSIGAVRPYEPKPKKGGK